MPTMQVDAQLLAADTDNRRLEYLILPFGEEGRTNLGRVRASMGVVTLPTNPADLVLNLEHDRVRPVGRAVSIVEQPDGIRAAFDILTTTAGNDLLTEAKAGVRAGASVEIDDTVIRDGHLKGGRLTAVAAVTTPAFPSATLMVAADCGDLPTARKDTTMADEVTTDEVEETSTDQDETTTPEAAEASPAMAAARAPLGVQAPRAMTAASDRKHSLLTASQMLADIVKRHGTRGGHLAAALSEITSADTLEVTSPESLEGKIWEGRRYQRRYVQAIQNAGLTALKYRGWKWTDGEKPVMAAYAGFPAQPASGPVSATETVWEPDMYAGAWQHDRKHRDFSDPNYWSEFFIEVATSYSTETDQDTVTALWDGGTAVTASAAAQPADVPDALFMIVKGALAVSPKGAASFAFVNLTDYEDVLYTVQDKVLPYLKVALGLEDGSTLDFKLLATDQLSTGEVLVGVKEAAVFRELPGAPIRVDAEVIAKGGIEQGVFGYAGVEIFEPGALAAVSMGA